MSGFRNRQPEPADTGVKAWVVLTARVGVIQTMVGELVTKPEHERESCVPVPLEP